MALNYNGVVYTELSELQLAIADLSDYQKQCIVNDFNGVINESNDGSTDPLTLKVKSLIHPNFLNLDISKVDFTVHLKENITLIKKVDMLQNGRPSVAKYYYPTVSAENLICSIDFVFIDNPLKFMVERTESLKYYKNNGDFVGPYLIHKRTYDFNNLKEATESIQERSTARRNIIDEVKVFLNGFIVNKSIAEGMSLSAASVNAMVLGGGFMQLHQNKINAWIETASGDLKPYLLNANNETQEAFLDWNIQAGVRVRDYFIQRISY
jgi:hypothetical protein